jgi:AcrR family transcriptional regulator
MSSTTPGRVRPRRTEVREQVVAAAREEFGAAGYAGVSVAQVARRAGFTKGAVYSNFGGKPELFAAAVHTYFTELVGAAVAETLAAADLDPAQRPSRALAARLTSDVVGNSRWPSLLGEFRVLAATDPALQQVYADLRTTQRDQLVGVLRGSTGQIRFADGLDLEVAATLLLTCVHSLAVEHAVAPATLPPALVESLFTHLLDGILA